MSDSVKKWHEMQEEEKQDNLLQDIGNHYHILFEVPPNCSISVLINCEVVYSLLGMNHLKFYV